MITDLRKNVVSGHMWPEYSTLLLGILSLHRNKIDAV